MAGVIKGRRSIRDVPADGPPPPTTPTTGSPARFSNGNSYRPESLSMGAGDAASLYDDDDSELLTTSDAEAEVSHDAAAADATKPSTTPQSTPKPTRTSPLLSRKERSNLNGSAAPSGPDVSRPAQSIPPPVCPVKSVSNIWQSTWLLVLGGLLLVWLYMAYSGAKVMRPPVAASLECTLDDLAQKYKQQDSCMWDRLAAGIDYIIRGQQSNDPGVFLFVHQGGKRIDQLVRDVAKRTAECYGQPNGPSEMSPDDFRADRDYRNAIQKYKELTDESHVVIVPLLNDIPGETAVALHTICDTHTPLALDTIIFLSMKLPRSNGENPTLETVEGDLRELWGHVLRQSQLEPLITRVTEQVVILK